MCRCNCSIYYKSYYFHIPTRQQSSYFQESTDLSSRSIQSTFCIDLYILFYVLKITEVILCNKMFKDEYDWPNKPFLEYEKAEGRRPAHQCISPKCVRILTFIWFWLNLWSHFPVVLNTGNKESTEMNVSGSHILIDLIESMMIYELWVWALKYPKSSNRK